MPARHLLVLPALCLFACGGEDPEAPPMGNGGTGPGGMAASGGMPDSGGAAPTGGSGGTVGGAGGGSGGASNSGEVRGAVSLNILSPEGCSLDAQYLDFPAVSGGHPVTATEKRSFVENGGMTEDGEPVQVFCDWGNGDADILFSVGPAGRQRRITFSTSNVPMGEMLGGLQLSAFDFPGTGEYGSTVDGICTFRVIEANEQTRSVWGEFSCGGFKALEGDDDDPCAIGPSYYYFENCTLPE